MSRRELCPKCFSHTALGNTKCFKCGYIQQRFTSNTFYAKPKETELPLPEGIVYNPHQFHTDAILWLASAHIYNTDIIKQGIGYCPNEHKVFIPAYDKNTTLRFYQLRALDPQVANKYKYLTYGGCSQYLILYTDHNNKTVFIVEDHLSAIRLRKHVNVACLSGTYLSVKNASALVLQASDFVFWLDSDKPGLAALFKCLKAIKSAAIYHQRRALFTGLDIPDYSFSHIDYDIIKEDPKRYQDSHIVEILSKRGISCGNI